MKILYWYMKWRWGVLGSLKPPVGPNPPWACPFKNGYPFWWMLWYFWRYFCWSVENDIYRRTGLPMEWSDRVDGWYQNAPASTEEESEG